MKKNKYILDLFKAWGILIIAEILISMLGTSEWQRPQLHGLIQFWPFAFFVILSLLEKNIVITNLNSNKKTVTKFDKNRCKIVWIVATILSSAVFAVIMLTNQNIRYYWEKNLYIFAIIIYIILVNEIVITFRIDVMYYFNRKIFFVVLVTTIIATYYFSYIITPVIIRGIGIFLILAMLYTLINTLPKVLIIYKN